LIDRIDIHVEVPVVPYRALTDKRDGTGSHEMHEQVVQARRRQASRFEGLDGLSNARMNSRQVRLFCKIDEAGENLIKQAVYELGLSARAHDKVLKIARTIADIEDSADIEAQHIAEAIQYRRLDRRL
jgi:magnesium chelatase family protein